MSGPAARAMGIAGELAAAASSLVSSAEDVAAAAEDVARLESLYLAAVAQAGCHDVRPSIREHAATLLHGRAHGLRPHVPFTTSAAADRAAVALESWAPPAELVRAAE
ncbi:MAG TPA: hypothetical protein VIL79_07325 [Thermoleophilia bacterium]